MTSWPERTERAARVARAVSRLVALSLVAAVIAVVLMAPADAATPTSNPGGLALSVDHHEHDAATLGDPTPTQEHGISWAARKPARAALTLALFVAAVIIGLATVASGHRRLSARQVPAHRSLAWSTSVCRGPPAASLARL